MRTAQERGGKGNTPSLSFLLRLTQIDRASPLGATERRRLASMSDLHLAEGLIIHPLSLHPERAILRRFLLDFGVYTLQNPFTFIYHILLHTDIFLR